MANDLGETTDSSSPELYRTAGEQPQQLSGEMGVDDPSSDAGSNKDVKEPSLNEAIADAIKSKSTDSSAVEGAEEKELAEADESDEARTKGEAAEEEVSHEEEDNKEKEDSVVKDKEQAESDKGPVPYERFSEVVEARKQSEELLTKVKPMVENYQKINTFCQQHGITPERFEAALRFEALRQANPAEALKLIQPQIDELRGFVGDKLPNDLQLKVDEGKMELDDAKELAKLRAQAKLDGKRVQETQQSLQQQQQEQLKKTLVSAFQSWESNKRGLDPDYKPKAKPTDPDGKWELAKQLFTGMVNEINDAGEYVNPVRTPEEMVALQDKAYTQAGRFLSRAKPATPKRLSSTGSSTTNGTTKMTIENAPTLAQAVSIALNGRR